MLSQIAPKPDLPAGDLPASDAASTGTPESPPREQTHAEGILVVGRELLPHPGQSVREIALRPLIDLVRQTTLWAQHSGNVVERMGDFRFLVLEFKRPNDLLTYVQIWCEPTRELIMEVGPAKRGDPACLADRIAQPLIGRGFEIGGNADNFHKTLPVPKPDDQARIANELLSILVDVLGYDGRTDLAYKIAQDTFLEAGHVFSGITRFALRSLLRVWGLEATTVSDDPTVLDAQSHGIGFRLHLCAPKSARSDVFWEVHCRARFHFPRERLTGLLTEVNDRAWLLKACVLEASGQDAAPVALSYGFNLAGGVTQEHLRSQIFEWLENVRRICMSWCKPAETAANAESTPVGSVH